MAREVKGFAGRRADVIGGEGGEKDGEEES